MIQFPTLDALLVARLDAEGTDSYDLNLDRIPAINSAQRFIHTTLNSLLEKKKVPGESLRDLNYTAVFQTSLFGQVDLDLLLGSSSINGRPHKLWTVIAVYPEFQSSARQVILPDTVATHSSIRQDIRFVSPLKAAKRYTQSQWADMKLDKFAPGSPLMTNEKLKEYGYLFGTRAIGDGSNQENMLSVVGVTPGQPKLVAVSYLKVPNTVPEMPDLENDPLYASTSLEWPDSILELLLSVSANIITVKQGDGSTLNGLSAQEAGILLNAIA